MGGACSVCAADPRDDPIGRRLAVLAKRPEVEDSPRRDTENKAVMIDSYMQSPKGYLIFTRAFLPIFSESSEINQIKGLICYCPGYTDSIDWFMERNYIKLAQGGYVVFAIDHFGHGRSDGLWISHEMDQIIDDARHCFAQFRAQLNDPLSTVSLHLRYSCNPDIGLIGSMLTKSTTVSRPKKFDETNSFLMGYSMGGGLCVNISLLDPKLWCGMVILAPMVSIHEDLKPPDCIISVGSCCLVPCCPTKEWTPSKSVSDYLFQDPVYFDEYKANPLRYDPKPRLKTGFSMLQFTIALESSLDKVSVPFMVMHGSDDKVTDPSISQKLYDSAGVSDKGIKIYQDAWHNLYADPYSRDVVFDDILSWLDQRVKKYDNDDDKLGSDDNGNDENEEQKKSD